MSESTLFKVSQSQAVNLGAYLFYGGFAVMLLPWIVIGFNLSP